jgi:hypothetical protein
MTRFAPTFRLLLLRKKQEASATANGRQETSNDMYLLINV